MDQLTKRPFEDLFASIASEQPLPIHLLFRLSDLKPDEMALFQRQWPTLDEERRRVILRHLVDISEENFSVDFAPVFGYCLHDSSASVRQAALDGLWDSTDVRLIEPIIQLMKQDESTAVREAAARSLAHYVLLGEWGEIPDRYSTIMVTNLLAVYDDPETAVSVQRAALEALGAASHPRISGLIRDAYESDDAGMQLSAVFAMGNNADPRWLPVIVGEMEAYDADMRAEAARAAGAIGEQDVISELAELVYDEVSEVQEAAILALGQIGGETASQILSDLLDDEEFEPLHELVELALDEMSWIDDDLTVLNFDYDDLDDENDLIE